MYDACAPEVNPGAQYDFDMTLILFHLTIFRGILQSHNAQHVELVS